jgi:cysteinyl-tRNA synthetase
MHIRGKNTQEWTLQCASPSVDGSFEFCPRICETDSDNAIAVAFTSLALALRYHAPIATTVQDTCSSLYTIQEIQDKFPLYKSVNQLKKPANRVQSNLQRGFEIHKLTGALKVAMKKGDFKAADRIREQLDKFDSMDDLPTTKQFETSDFDSLQ